MRWTPGKTSGDVRDMRGSRMGGRGMGVPIAGGGGLVGVVVTVLILLLGGGGGSLQLPQSYHSLPATNEAPAGSGDSVPGAPDPEKKTVQFVSFVLDDVQGFWAKQFQAGGSTYPRSQLVLFRDGVRTGCGGASSATGPFYCPADQTVYIDLEFFKELATRFDAPGDFAQAYVIAHEIGHHVQKVTGIESKVRKAQQEDSGRVNDLSIRMELQADCLAGVWGHSTYERGILEEGDLEEGLTAAASVGDDRIQKQATGRVNQETWTHGSSEQRTKWFRAGFDSGDPDKCDTFSGDL
jgi:predicted metalloprotease